MMYNEFGGEEGDDFDEEDFIGEYAIDDTLDPLTRLERYHTSDFSLQRLVLPRTASAGGGGLRPLTEVCGLPHVHFS